MDDPMGEAENQRMYRRLGTFFNVAQESVDSLCWLSPARKELNSNAWLHPTRGRLSRFREDWGQGSLAIRSEGCRCCGITTNQTGRVR
jgi:hypothetical protein